MKFIQLFFLSAITSSLIYFGMVWLLIDAPIPAEYWVNEMITIKKHLVKEYAGKRKIIVAGGSSTLFGIDAEYATKALDMPVINFGLHAGLPLSKIFNEVNQVVEKGDILILPLEPNYYECNETLGIWNMENIIAWDHESWDKLNDLDKIKFVVHVPFGTFSEMVIASIKRKFFQSSINKRLESFNEELVLLKFKNRQQPTHFEYSAFNLDNHGDMLMTATGAFEGSDGDVRKPNHICSSTLKEISSFVKNMKNRGVDVYFANPPYVATRIPAEEITKSEALFRNQWDEFSCFIDTRKELVMDKRYFFNSNLHLNEAGRSVRTKLFVTKAKKVLLDNNCH